MVHRAVAELFALVVPPACAACGAPVEHAQETICHGCRAGLRWLPARRCDRCALPLPCGPPCPAASAAFERALAVVAYDGTARRVVPALKYRGRFAVADALAAQMAVELRRARTHDGAALVPVPPRPGWRRRRGYDQAGLLAAALAHRTGMALQPCLARRGRARQVGAGRAARRTPGRLGIEARRPAPDVALLVDDVHTTGATLDACARALRGAGAGRVLALTWARTLR